MLDQDPLLAAVQPKILDLRKRTHFEYAGAAGGKLDFLGYPFCRGRILTVIEEDRAQYDQEDEIAWASGACMLVRMEAYQKAGGLDPWFFAHMEEIDLCWRMIACGYHIRYHPGSVVYHLGGGSLPYGNRRKTLLNFRNNLSMLIKNLPLIHLLFALPLRALLDAMAAIRTIFASRSFQDAGAIFSAWLQVFQNLPLLLRKRAEQPVKTNKLLWRGSILFAYYLRAVRSYHRL
jgi:GT2 family glycosyltransferase